MGWVGVTRAGGGVDGGAPPGERAQACVMTSNYGEAAALRQLAAPGRLPPVISGHNNYYLWGPGSCTGQVIIGVGFRPGDFQASPAHFASVTLAATERCPDCVIYEQSLPIVVASSPADLNIAKLWRSARHYE